MAEKQTKKAASDEAAVLEKIAGWRAPYDAIGKRLHEVITESVPELRPKLWYGMPGYAKGGPVLCFFRIDDRFSFGLTEKANVSVEKAGDGLIPSAWFLEELDAATEKRVAEIVEGAAG